MTLNRQSWLVLYRYVGKPQWTILIKRITNKTHRRISFSRYVKSVLLSSILVTVIPCFARVFYQKTIKTLMELIAGIFINNIKYIYFRVPFARSTRLEKKHLSCFQDGFCVSQIGFCFIVDLALSIFVNLFGSLHLPTSSVI